MNLFTLIIYGLFLFLMILNISKKSNYHIDEMFSFGLSNQKDYLTFEEGKYEFPKRLFNNYLTVNKNSRLIILKFGKIIQKIFILFFI